MLKKIFVVMWLASLLVCTTSNLKSQSDETFRMKLESILSKFKNYRYSTVSLYRMKDIKNVRKLIKEKDEAANLGAKAGNTNSTDLLKDVDPAILSIIEAGVAKNETSNDIARELTNKGFLPPEKFEQIYSYYLAKSGPGVKPVSDVYVVTTRIPKDEVAPGAIIAAIIVYDDKGLLSKTIQNASSPTNIYTFPELKDFTLDPNEYGNENLYDLIMTSFYQGQVKDMTLEAQGIGGFNRILPKKYGVTASLLKDENQITAEDIQKFKRITDGQPNDIVDKFNEVVVSADIISWRHYDYPILNGYDYTDTLSHITNSTLPKFGLELKYGIEDINYPSFWSERMTLSAIWDIVKLGIILPTNGWSSITEDVFKAERKLTYGSAGIAGELDFPIRVIPKSGVFHLGMGYVFGDAAEGPKERNLDPLTYKTNTDDNDYLVRFNGQLLYTFGVAVDEDFMLRFSLGGTVYTMEKWYYQSTEDSLTRTRQIEYKKYKDEAVGGISGKVDFMVIKTSTPFGATLQYFDEGLYTNIWLQIPVVDNTFAIRLDGKAFVKAFTDTPHPWETSSVFIPMARFIVNF